MLRKRWILTVSVAQRNKGNASKWLLLANEQLTLTLKQHMVIFIDRSIQRAELGAKLALVIFLVHRLKRSWTERGVWRITYLYAATARLFRYFWAVMTPTNRKLLDRETGFSVAGETLSCCGHKTPLYSFLRPAFNPQPAGFAFRFCPAFFSSVALGKMSLEARVNPTTSPSRTLNHALRLRPAIPKNFTSL